MWFHNLHIENILSFQEANLSLANRGLVLIRGAVEGSTATVSNGAGKSTLVDSLLLSLFGRTTRGLRGEGLTHFNNGNGLVTLTGATETHRPFTLTRPFKHSEISRTSLEIGGVPIIGEEGIKTALRGELLGPISFSTFVASCIFSDVGLFTRIGDSEKKEIFEDLIALSVLKEAYERASTVNKATQEAKRHIELARAKLEGEANALREFLKTESQRVAQLEASQAAHLHTHKQQREAIEARIAIAIELFHTTKKLEKDLQKEEEEVALRLAQYKQAFIEHSEEYEKKKSASIGLKKQRTMIEARLRKVESFDSECPECEQDIPEQKKTHLIETNNKLLVRLDKEIREQDILVAHAGAEVNGVYIARDAALGRKSFLEASITNARYQQEIATRDQLTAQKQVEELATQIGRLMEHSPVEEAKKSLKKAEGDLRELRTSQIRMELEIEDLNTKINLHCNFWLEGFGPAGIKSLLIEEAFPYVNDRARFYSEILSDGEIVPEISAVSQTAKGEDRERISVVVHTRFGPRVYLACSKGQKCRVDIVTTLAIGDYASLHCPYPMRLAMLDELFDPLDESGAIRAVRLLETLKETRDSIFVISHSPYIGEHFTEKELVTLDCNGVSRLEHLS